MMMKQQELLVEEASPNSSSHHHNKVSPSPSFSSYSSETLAEIAARVIEELRRNPTSLSDEDDDDADALFPPWENDSFFPQNDEEEQVEQNDNDEDFEFAFVSREFSSPVSADDIFYNGQIKPMYPIFGVPPNDAVFSVPNNNNTNTNTTIAPTPRRRLPLRKLMFEEGETASCSSSTDESVDLVEGAYCVWTPNSVVRERKKSNSTGSSSSSSKRWKLRDLLLRSHSDGKDKKQQQQKQQQPDLFQIATNKLSAKPTQNASVGTEQNKRKSSLPYRPEFVGLFANVNGLGRNLSPF